MEEERKSERQTETQRDGEIRRKLGRDRGGERSRDRETHTQEDGEIRKRQYSGRGKRGGDDVSGLLAPGQQTQLLSWATTMQASRDRDLTLPVSLFLSISGTAQLSPLLDLMGSSPPGAALPLPPGLPVNAKCFHST